MTCSPRGQAAEGTLTQNWAGRFHWNCEPRQLYTQIGSNVREEVVPVMRLPLIMLLLIPAASFSTVMSNSNAIGAGDFPALPTPSSCRQDERVCCFDHDCALLGEWECEDLCGKWYPDHDSCDPNPCPVEATCCIGEDCLILREQECLDLYGVWHPEWDRCGPHNPCEFCRSVCCLGEDCYVMTEEECWGFGGVFHFWWEGCGPPNPCTDARVCCVCEECILVQDADDCEDLGGEHHPDWGSCDPNPCGLQGIEEEPIIPEGSTPVSWGRIKAVYRD